MKKVSFNKSLLIAGCVSLLVAVILTVLVKYVDVQQYNLINLATGNVVGDVNNIGFATLNLAFRDLIGTSHTFYKLTQYLGYISFLPVGVFAVIGLIQFIQRKSLKKVDQHILCLGAFYIVLLAIYFLFEVVQINVRPVIINGEISASFPSSHTMLAVGVISTLIPAVHHYINKKWLRTTIDVIAIIYGLFILVGRLISGVHWISDILVGVIYATALVFFYLCGLSIKNIEK